MIKKFLYSKKTHIVDLIAVFLLTLFFLVLLFHNFFKDPFYYFAADISEVYFPWWVYLNQSIRSFAFPILNPFWFFGSLPFAALETGVFYPFYLVAQFLFDAKANLDKAYFFFFGIQLVHYLLASISMYLLLRRGIKLSRFASIFGGLLYSCSGAFIGRFVHVPYLLQLSWLPLLFLTYFLFLEKRKLIWAVISSVILALIINIGHPQITFYIVSFFILAVFYFSFVGKMHKKIGFFFTSLGIVFLSFLLTAYKLFLSLELSHNIVRTAGSMTLKNLYNSLHPLYYLTLLVPNLFGRHRVGYWGSEYPWGNWEHYLYIGIIPLFFLVYSFFWKNKRTLLFTVMGFFITVLLSFGKFFWLSKVLNQYMPFSDRFAFVSRIADLFHFFVVILVAIGIHTLFEEKNDKLKYLVAVIPIVFFGLILFSLNQDTISVFNVADRLPKTTKAIQFAVKSLFMARYLYLISTAVFLSFFFLPKRLFFVLLIAVYAFDIFKTSGDFNPIESSPGKPSSYFGISNSDIKLIKKDNSVFRVHNLAPRNANMIQQVESSYGYHTIETKSYHDIVGLIDFKNRQVLNMLNLKYFLYNQDLSVYGGFTNISSNIWLNKEVLHRVFFVPSYKLVKDNKDMKYFLTKIDPAEIVLFDRKIASVLRLSDYQGDPNHIEAEVSIKEYKSDRLTLSIDTNQPGFLVFSQLRYPGWEAFVDWRKEKLLPANLSLYALPILSGEHAVVFRFQSRPFYYGLAISSLSMLVMLLFLATPKLRKYIV